MEYTFKDEYYGLSNLPVIETGMNTTFFVSGSVKKSTDGVGTKENPYCSYNKTFATSATGNPKYNVEIFSDGYHKLSFFRNTAATNSQFIGNNMRTCYLDGNMTCNGSFSRIYFFRMKLNLNITWTGGNNYVNAFYYCDILNISQISYTNILTFYNSIVRFNSTAGGNNNSYVGINNKTITNNNLSLVEKCNVDINQSVLTSYVDLYYAFSDCNFRIGNETGYTSLTGETEAELRADFIRRCDEQGLTYTTKTEYGETLPVYRWVFAKKSSHDGAVLPNSIIHDFERRRKVYFGYTSCREGILVSDAVNVPNSISMGNPNQNIEIFDNAAKLPSNSDILTKVTSKIQSNICWLGGLKQLTGADVVHNFDMKYGLAVDTSENIESTPAQSGDIEPGSYYVVRSVDEDIATIDYNGTSYSSSLAERKNIFLGVLGQTEFAQSTNATLYKLTGQLQYRHIDMRIANKIPDEIIKTGSLASGYWYLVEHDSDQENTTDYVTYKGVKYPATSSFLTDNSNLAFTTTGNIHLRRCWKEDFNYGVEAIDKDFWKNEQKPKWFKVIGSDLRCLMKRNVEIENEMQIDENGDYITSGHPQFYKIIVGDNGTLLPSFPIKGAYMQIRLVISTLNPM